GQRPRTPWQRPARPGPAGEPAYEGTARQPADEPEAGGAPAPVHPYQAGHGYLRPQDPSHAQGAVWRRRGGPGGRPSYSRPTAQPRGTGRGMTPHPSRASPGATPGTPRGAASARDSPGRQAFRAGRPLPRD